MPGNISGSLSSSESHIVCRSGRLIIAFAWAPFSRVPFNQVPSIGRARWNERGYRIARRECFFERLVLILALMLLSFTPLGGSFMNIPIFIFRGRVFLISGHGMRSHFVGTIHVIRETTRENAMQIH